MQPSYKQHIDDPDLLCAVERWRRIVDASGRPHIAMAPGYPWMVMAPHVWSITCCLSVYAAYAYAKDFVCAQTTK